MSISSTASRSRVSLTSSPSRLKTFSVSWMASSRVADSRPWAAISDVVKATVAQLLQLSAGDAALVEHQRHVVVGQELDVRHFVFFVKRYGCLTADKNCIIHSF